MTHTPRQIQHQNAIRTDLGKVISKNPAITDVDIGTNKSTMSKFTVKFARTTILPDEMDHRPTTRLLSHKWKAMVAV